MNSAEGRDADFRFGWHLCFVEVTSKWLRRYWYIVVLSPLRERLCFFFKMTVLPPPRGRRPHPFSLSEAHALPVDHGVQRVLDPILHSGRVFPSAPFICDRMWKTFIFSFVGKKKLANFFPRPCVECH